MRKGYEASVIIPAYNEGKRLGKVLRSIKKLNRRYQVIVVDDGSEDDTHAVAKENGFDAVRLEKNKGKGYACRTGAMHAKSSFLVFMDADFQFDPMQIPQFVGMLRENDMVIGVRNYKDIPMARKISNKFARTVVNKATGRNFTDVLCGFRAIRKDALLKLGLREDRYEIESEMIIKAAKKKLRISELPVSVRYNGGGMSVMDSLRVSAYQLKHLLRKK